MNPGATTRSGPSPSPSTRCSGRHSWHSGCPARCPRRSWSNLTPARRAWRRVRRPHRRSRKPPHRVQQSQQPSVTPSGAAPTATAAPNATAAPSTTTSCVGLSICTPPPPDAEGNPACYYRDGWVGDTSGSGINVYYFRESSNAANGEQVTADVRMKDGTTASQIAAIDPGQSIDQIQFPGIDASAVQEVLLTTSAGRCFVIGPNS